jgi:hypothetical protein
MLILDRRPVIPGLEQLAEGLELLAEHTGNLMVHPHIIREVTLMEHLGTISKASLPRAWSHPLQLRGSEM